MEILYLYMVKPAQLQRAVLAGQNMVGFLEFFV